MADAIRSFGRPNLEGLTHFADELKERGLEYMRIVRKTCAAPNWYADAAIDAVLRIADTDSADTEAGKCARDHLAEMLADAVYGDWSASTGFLAFAVLSDLLKRVNGRSKKVDCARAVVLVYCSAPRDKRYGPARHWLLEASQATGFPPHLRKLACNLADGDIDPDAAGARKDICAMLDGRVPRAGGGKKGAKKAKAQRKRVLSRTQRPPDLKTWPNIRDYLKKHGYGLCERQLRRHRVASKKNRRRYGYPFADDDGVAAYSAGLVTWLVRRGVRRRDMPKST